MVEGRTAPGELIDRYARYILIEDTIADCVNFFHMDALSAIVLLRIGLEVQLTLMASALYHLLGARFRAAEPANLFCKFVDASATVDMSDDETAVTLGRCVPNPYLIAARYADSTASIPGLYNRPSSVNFDLQISHAAPPLGNQVSRGAALAGSTRPKVRDADPRPT